MELADGNAEEEALAENSLTILVDDAELLCGVHSPNPYLALQPMGSIITSINADCISRCIALSRLRSQALQALLKAAVH